jgi:hypothetical protein
VLRRPSNQGQPPTRRRPGFRQGRSRAFSLLLAVVTAVVAPAWVGSPWVRAASTAAGAEVQPSVAPLGAQLTSLGTSATAPVVKKDRSPVRVAQRHARGGHLSHPFAVTRTAALAIPQTVEDRTACAASSQGSTPPAERTSRGPPAQTA